MNKRDLYMDLHKQGLSVNDIALKFNIKPSSVRQAIYLAKNNDFKHKYNKYQHLYKKNQQIVKTFGIKQDTALMLIVKLSEKQVNILFKAAADKHMGIERYINSMIRRQVRKLKGKQ